MVKPQAGSGIKRGPSAPKKPSSRRKAKDVFDELRRRIALQQFAPGAPLREHELSAELGAPRAVIREALVLLEQRALIERIPNRGAIVARLDMPQIYEIYDVREVLEGACVRLATINAPPGTWDDLVVMFRGPMVQYVERGDYESFIAGYEIFRRRLIEAAANPFLANMLDSIYEKTQAVIRRAIILPGRAEEGLKEHCAVLSAMCAGDADKAEVLRRENMRSAKKCLKRYQNFVI
ncbi:MAG: GntR family transcriptional regulator [Burkholderiaceae bacterium]